MYAIACMYIVRADAIRFVQITIRQGTRTRSRTQLLLRVGNYYRSLLICIMCDIIIRNIM